MALSLARPALALLLFVVAVSCGGGQSLYDICGCVPSSPDTKDHRHDEKHVPIPDENPVDITVGTIVGWPIDSTLLPATAPRAGRELQVFHIGHAFLQAVRVEHSDCDIHMEIADTADKLAPRVIVETPVDSEYCTARQGIQLQLSQHGVFIGREPVGSPPQEISPAIPADVVGLAFEDNPHLNRGSAQVVTIWELHPAIVRLLQ